LVWGVRMQWHISIAFLGNLEEGGWKVSNILREYTVADSNPRMDAGWADVSRGATCSDRIDRDPRDVHSLTRTMS